MNNKKIAIVGVLAVIVTMMVGYALFSENITINGTATAKGDFALTTTCEKGVISEYINTYGEEDLDGKEGGYENDYCTTSGNTVSYGSKLLYPGAIRYFTVKTKNTGTIDASLNLETGVEESYGTACLDSDEDGTYETCTEESNSYFFSGLASSTGETLILDSNGNVVSGDDFYDETTSNLILKPGYTMVLILKNQWQDKISGDGSNKINLEYKNASIKINFVQYSK